MASAFLWWFRDFSETIVYKGPEVGNSFSIGDKVYGFIPFHKQGSFSEVIVASKDHVRLTSH